MSSARVLANRYRLDEHAAEGGMGSVWAATDLQLERQVAVKLMSAAFAEQADARARFLREAQAAAKIQSPHVVSTLDYGVDGSTPYIVMEWLDGESLGARLKRELRLSTTATGAILRQVARGLRSAHELGVVHRDLKPDNLFLQRDHDEEIVKILDFGVAKARGQTGDQTRTGVILGSLRYMSPEQARANRDTDHRSDLWSLGVIAYRCLTGELPFSGASDGDLLVNICTEAPLPASRHEATLAPLDAFFAKCLAKDPAARFGSAAELAAAYFAALGVDDPSRRTRSAEAARGALPSFTLPPASPPEAAHPAPLPPPQVPPLPALQPRQLVDEPALRPRPPISQPSSPSVSQPLGAPPGQPLGAPPGQPLSPALQAVSSVSGASADPASRSAILVASMPPPGRGASKLGLAIGIGGAVGALLALGSLMVLLSTGSGASKSGAGGPRGAATAAPELREAPLARPAAEPPDELAEDQAGAGVEPALPAPAGSAATSSASTSSASTSSASTNTAAPSTEPSEPSAAQVATAPSSATPRATPSARAGASGSAKSPGTKPLSRPLIPSNPY